MEVEKTKPGHCPLYDFHYCFRDSIPNRTILEAYSHSEVYAMPTRQSIESRKTNYPHLQNFSLTREDCWSWTNMKHPFLTNPFYETSVPQILSR